MASRKFQVEDKDGKTRVVQVDVPTDASEDTIGDAIEVQLNKTYHDESEAAAKAKQQRTVQFEKKHGAGLKGPQPTPDEAARNQEFLDRSQNEGFLQSFWNNISGPFKFAYNLATEPKQTISQLPEGVAEGFVDPLAKYAAGNWQGALGDVAGILTLSKLLRSPRESARAIRNPVRTVSPRASEAIAATGRGIDAATRKMKFGRQTLGGSIGAALGSHFPGNPYVGGTLGAAAGATAMELPNIIKTVRGSLNAADLPSYPALNPAAVQFLKSAAQGITDVEPRAPLPIAGLNFSERVTPPSAPGPGGVVIPPRALPPGGPAQVQTRTPPALPVPPKTEALPASRVPPQLPAPTQIQTPPPPLRMPAVGAEVIGPNPYQGPRVTRTAPVVPTPQAPFLIPPMPTEAPSAVAPAIPTVIPPTPEPVAAPAPIAQPTQIPPTPAVDPTFEALFGKKTPEIPSAEPPTPSEGKGAKTTTSSVEAPQKPRSVPEQSAPADDYLNVNNSPAALARAALAKRTPVQPPVVQPPTPAPAPAPAPVVQAPKVEVLPAEAKAPPPPIPTNTGSRWNVDPGAIPGEPSYWLDFENPDESPAMITEEDDGRFYLHDNDGRNLGKKKGYETADEAQAAGETLFPKPTRTVDVTPSAPRVEPPKPPQIEAPTETVRKVEPPSRTYNRPAPPVKQIGESDVLDFIKRRKQVTVDDIQRQFGISADAAKEHLKALSDKGETHQSGQYHRLGKEPPPSPKTGPKVEPPSARKAPVSPPTKPKTEGSTPPAKTSIGDRVAAAGEKEARRARMRELMMRDDLSDAEETELGNLMDQAKADLEPTPQDLEKAENERRIRRDELMSKEELTPEEMVELRKTVQSSPENQNQISHDELYSIANAIKAKPTALGRYLSDKGYDVAPSKFGGGKYGITKAGSYDDVVLKLSVEQISNLLDRLGKKPKGGPSK